MRWDMESRSLQEKPVTVQENNMENTDDQSWTGQL